MPRDSRAEKEAFEERVAICVANGVSEERAHVVAERQIWAMIHESSQPRPEERPRDMPGSAPTRPDTGLSG